MTLIWYFRWISNWRKIGTFPSRGGMSNLETGSLCKTSDLDYSADKISLLVELAELWMGVLSGQHSLSINFDIDFSIPTSCTATLSFSAAALLEDPQLLPIAISGSSDETPSFCFDHALNLKHLQSYFAYSGKAGIPVQTLASADMILVYVDEIFELLRCHHGCSVPNSLRYTAPCHFHRCSQSSATNQSKACPKNDLLDLETHDC